MPKQVTNVASDDALTTIYRITNDENEEAKAARISERLGIRAASVSGMLARLKRDRLILIDKKKNVTLTKTGLNRATQMVRRHRIAECLLVNKFSLEWWRAYEEAHLFEHAFSEVTTPLIVKLLNNPMRSPFGYPIPGISKSLKLSRETILDMDEGQSALVERVFEEDEKLLQFFQEIQLFPDATIKLVKKTQFVGTISISVAGKNTVIGVDIAKKIWIKNIK